jgi:hypothetical protein
MLTLRRSATASVGWAEPMTFERYAELLKQVVLRPVQEASDHEGV